MPKKLKLNLKDLKVQSFVTTLKDTENKLLKGGGSEFSCPTGPGTTNRDCICCGVDPTPLSLCTSPPGCQAC